MLKSHYDIGIAVGAEGGLVVPVVRDADRKSFAELEREIAELAEKARTNTLTLEDLRGGTFTITNGGVYGSLLSTPILSPPQVGILGMHRIQERPSRRGSVMARRPRVACIAVMLRIQHAVGAAPPSRHAECRVRRLTRRREGARQPGRATDEPRSAL